MTSVPTLATGECRALLEAVRTPRARARAPTPSTKPVMAGLGWAGLAKAWAEQVFYYYGITLPPATTTTISCVSIVSTLDRRSSSIIVRWHCYPLQLRTR